MHAAVIHRLIGDFMWENIIVQSTGQWLTLQIVRLEMCIFLGAAGEQSQAMTAFQLPY